MQRQTPSAASGRSPLEKSRSFASILPFSITAFASCSDRLITAAASRLDEHYTITTPHQTMPGPFHRAPATSSCSPPDATGHRIGKKCFFTRRALCHKGVRTISPGPCSRKHTKDRASRDSM
jgi:hypothetical protein